MLKVVNRFVGLGILIALLCAVQGNDVASAKARVDFDCLSVAEIPVSECEALVAFHTDLGGENWSASAQEGWLNTTEPCSWNGVTCENGHVVSLIQGDNGSVVGDVPPQIGDLIYLTTLDLTGNYITSIPAEIGNLVNLTRVSFGFNFSLTTLPEELWDLTNITNLTLFATGVTELSPRIGNLTNLTTLQLNGSLFTEIPSELWTLPNLTSLNVGSLV